MRTPLHSALRIPSELSVWGMRGLQTAVSALAIGRPPWFGGVLHALDKAAREKLGPEVGGAYRAGSQWMRWTSTPAMAGGRQALRGGIQALRSSIELMGTWSPADGWRIDLEELGNKLTAFEHFRFAGSIIGTGKRGGGEGLGAAVAAAAGLDRFLALWVIEGLGYDLAERAARRAKGPPEALLTDGRLDDLPSSCWLPLHTGMGLSLAGSCLDELDQARADQRVDGLLERFRSLCEVNSRPGHAFLVFEALGFVCRNLHPHLISRLDRRMQRRDPQLAALLWHGVGRALYFAPAGMVPGSAGDSLERALREAPREAGRRGTVSGVAWALTLVNLRTPAVLEAFVQRHGEGIPAWARQPFADGVTAAISVWHAVHGRDAYLRAWSSHRPETLRGEQRALWETLVRRPSEAAAELSGAGDTGHGGRNLNLRG